MLRESNTATEMLQRAGGDWGGDARGGCGGEAGRCSVRRRLWPFV